MTEGIKKESRKMTKSFTCIMRVSDVENVVILVVLITQFVVSVYEIRDV